MHPPAGKILNGGFADQFDEAFRERRARDPDFLCKRFDGPRPIWLCVKQGEGGTHLGVIKAGQPTATMALRHVSQLPLKQFEEERFRQSRQHGAMTRTRCGRFAYQVPQ